MNKKLNQVRLVPAVIIIVVFGCKPQNEQKKTIDPTPQTVAILPQKPAVEQSRIKPFTLTFINLIESNRLNKLPALTQKEIASYFVESIDENFADDYKYHLLDEVVTTPAYKMRLIAREYENENTVWLCLFDKNHKIMDAKEVYYDNAEGNYQVEAILKKDTLTLFMADVNDGRYTEVYSFDKNFKIMPVNTSKK
ncbi:hypothetical protein [Runella sp.]|uniref:hypothetical protein n=1 Tax=Runella sp. TaxID=1960881 RepID=UPI003D11EE04